MAVLKLHIWGSKGRCSLEFTDQSVLFLLSSPRAMWDPVSKTKLEGTLRSLPVYTCAHMHKNRRAISHKWTCKHTDTHMHMHTGACLHAQYKCIVISVFWRQDDCPNQSIDYFLQCYYNTSHINSLRKDSVVAYNSRRNSLSWLWWEGIKFD